MNKKWGCWYKKFCLQQAFILFDCTISQHTEIHSHGYWIVSAVFLLHSWGAVTICLEGNFQHLATMREFLSTRTSTHLIRMSSCSCHVCMIWFRQLHFSLQKSDRMTMTRVTVYRVVFRPLLHPEVNARGYASVWVVLWHSWTVTHCQRLTPRRQRHPVMTLEAVHGYCLAMMRRWLMTKTWMHWIPMSSSLS